MVYNNAKYKNILIIKYPHTTSLNHGLTKLYVDI